MPALAPLKSIAEGPFPLAFRDGGRRDDGDEVAAALALFASTTGDECGYDRFADESGGVDNEGAWWLAVWRAAADIFQALGTR
jgi:hypothetical protein